MSLLLGVDAGGTRTSAWIVDERGDVRGRAEGGPANYQSVGPAAARTVLADVVSCALTAGAATPAEVRYAAYGIAGADRPQDFAAIAALLPESPPAARRRLVNDTQLALRAGTSDGVGVALISGTGSNALGCAPDGTVVQLGGLGYELGDFGSAGDLGREALRLAMRGRDGRGQPTSLYDALCSALGVDPLEDVMDQWMSGASGLDDLGQLAPLVFEQAACGDAVARALLERAGAELALCAQLLMDRLFPAGHAVPVVLGGSVLQAGRETDETLVRTVAARLAERHPRAELRCLEVDPVVGAVLLACDLATPTDDATDFSAALQASIGSEFASPISA